MLRWLNRKTILILVLLAALYYGYTHFLGHPGGPPGMMGAAPPVSIAEVIARKVQLWGEFSGRLVAVDSAEIRPRVSGTIDAINFTEGQWVTKGQSLFTIDQRPYAAALQAAQARATLAEAEFARAKLLIGDKAIPQREFDQRKSEALAARAELIRAQLDVEHSLVKAPITGRVGRAEITVGNLVDAGGNAPILTTVVTSQPIYADFDIDEQSYLRYIQSAGTDTQKLNAVPVRLMLSGAQAVPYEGRVQSFDNRLDTGSGTLRVRAMFDNKDGSLIPGLFARVQLGGVGEADAILITDRAIGTDQNHKFVIVVGEDGKTERREIKPGGMADGLRIVESGLKPGEKIIVSGTQRVMMPGQPVMPEIVPMDGQVTGDGKQVAEETQKQDTPKD
jgi:multidrug efflux system membrane fusion protein